MAAPKKRKPAARPPMRRPARRPAKKTFGSRAAETGLVLATSAALSGLIGVVGAVFGDKAETTAQVGLLVTGGAGRILAEDGSLTQKASEAAMTSATGTLAYNAAKTRVGKIMAERKQATQDAALEALRQEAAKINAETAARYEHAVVPELDDAQEHVEVGPAKKRPRKEASA